MKYNNFTIEVVEKLKGDYAFSSTNSVIRVNASLMGGSQEDINIVLDEAIFARNEYTNTVNNLKAKGEKVSPTKVKQDAVSLARQEIINRIGQEEYARIHTATGVKVKVQPKPTQTKLDIDTTAPLVVKQHVPTQTKIELDEDALAAEFDNMDDTPVFKTENVEIPEGLPGLVANPQDFKEPVDVETIVEKQHENFDVFDVDFDLDLGEDF